MSKKGALDALDLSLLDLLAADARSTIKGLSERLNVPPTTVYYRLKKLERLRVVKGYTIVVDPEILGLSRVIALMKIEPDKADSVINEQRVLQTYLVTLILSSGSEGTFGWLFPLWKMYILSFRCPENS